LELTQSSLEAPPAMQAKSETIGIAMGHGQ